MCRVLLMNKQGEKEIEKTYGLDKYLKYLEKQMGGHGNGFALMKNGKIIKLEKGVNLEKNAVLHAEETARKRAEFRFSRAGAVQRYCPRAKDGKYECRINTWFMRH